MINNEQEETITQVRIAYFHRVLPQLRLTPTSKECTAFPRAYRLRQAHKPPISRPAARCCSSTRPSASTSATATTIIVGFFSKSTLRFSTSFTTAP